MRWSKPEIAQIRLLSQQQNGRNRLSFLQPRQQFFR
jgi:hypothetical protein